MEPKTPASNTYHHYLRGRTDTNSDHSHDAQNECLVGPEKENTWPEHDVQNQLEVRSKKLRNENLDSFRPFSEAILTKAFESTNQESDFLSQMMSRYCSPDDKSSWEGFNIPSPIIFDLAYESANNEREATNVSPEFCRSSHILDGVQSNEMIQTPDNPLKASFRDISQVVSESKRRNFRQNDTLDLSISSMGSGDWNLEVLGEPPPPSSEKKGVHAFKAFRTNSTNIALHESQAYLDKIKNLEYQLILAEDRAKREAESRADFEQRNKILLTEVRFADQTCLEECCKSKNLQSELDRMRTENDELRSKLSEATTSLMQCQRQLETQKLQKRSNGIQVKSIASLGIKPKDRTGDDINHVNTSVANDIKVASYASIRDARGNVKKRDLDTHDTSNDTCASSDNGDFTHGQTLPVKGHSDERSETDMYLKDIESLKADIASKQKVFNRCVTSLQSFRLERTKEIDSILKEFPNLATIEAEKLSFKAVLLESIDGNGSYSQMEAIFFDELHHLQEIVLFIEGVITKANQKQTEAGTLMQDNSLRLASRMAVSDDLRLVSRERSELQCKESQLPVSECTELQQQLIDANEKLEILRDEYIEMKESLEEQVQSLTTELRVKSSTEASGLTQFARENALSGFDENDGDKEMESKLVSNVAHLTEELESSRSAMNALVAANEKAKIKTASDCQLLADACKEGYHDLSVRFERQFKTVGSRIDGLMRSISILKGLIEVDTQSGNNSQPGSQVYKVGDVKAEHREMNSSSHETKTKPTFVDCSKMSSRDSILPVLGENASRQITRVPRTVELSDRQNDPDAVSDSLSVLSQSTNSENEGRTTSLAQHIEWLVGSPIFCVSNQEHGKVQKDKHNVNQNVSPIGDICTSNDSEPVLSTTPPLSPASNEYNTSDQSETIFPDKRRDGEIRTALDQTNDKRDMKNLYRILKALLRDTENQKLSALKEKLNENEHKLSVSEQERYHNSAKLLAMEKEHAAMERSKTDALETISLLKEEIRRLKSELPLSVNVDSKLDSLAHEVRLIAAGIAATTHKSETTKNENLVTEILEEEIQRLKSENTDLSRKCDRLRTYTKKLALKCDEWRTFQSGIIAKYKKTQEKVHMLCLYNEQKDKLFTEEAAICSAATWNLAQAHCELEEELDLISNELAKVSWSIED